MTHHNLGPESAQWARELENRLTALEDSRASARQENLLVGSVLSPKAQHAELELIELRVDAATFSGSHTHSVLGPPWSRNVSVIGSSLKLEEGDPSAGSVYAEMYLIDPSLPAPPDGIWDSLCADISYSETGDPDIPIGIYSNRYYPTWNTSNPSVRFEWEGVANVDVIEAWLILAWSP